MKEFFISIGLIYLFEGMSLKLLVAYCAGIYTATVYDCKPYVIYVENGVKDLKQKIEDSIKEESNNKDSSKDSKEDSNNKDSLQDPVRAFLKRISS